MAADIDVSTKIVPAEKRGSISDFELPDLAGTGIKLSDYEGKVESNSYSALLCEPCKQELGHFNNFFGEYQDKGFQVLSIATDAPDTLSKVRAIVRRKRWTMPTLLDTEGAVSAVLNPRGSTPFTIFVDRKGRMAMGHEGYASGDEAMYIPVMAHLLAE